MTQGAGNRPVLTSAEEEAPGTITDAPPVPTQPTEGQPDPEVSQVGASAPSSSDNNTPKTGNGSSQTKVDDVTRLQQELERIQTELEEAKKDKAVQDARKKETDAIGNQRVTSKLAIDEASDKSDKWQTEDIDPNFTDPAERADLQDKINDAIAAVNAVEARVNTLKQDVVEDERLQKVAEAELAKQQKLYADAQKQLGQLGTRIKDSQANVEKLRTEVKNAVDAKQWKRAFGKNYQLQQTIADANTWLDPATEAGIITNLTNLDTQIKTTRNSITTAKKQLEARTQALKDAEAELKTKRDGLSSTIGNFL